MIKGAHFLLYSQNPEADREFFRDILGFRAVDAGEGWLIMALPPAELGVHPADGSFVQAHADHKMLGAVLYLMCEDLEGTMRVLEARNVHCSPAVRAEWGITTAIRLPSGGAIGLYQPLHPTAISMH